MISKNFIYLVYKNYFLVKNSLEIEETNSVYWTFENTKKKYCNKY